MWFCDVRKRGGLLAYRNKRTESYLLMRSWSRSRLQIRRKCLSVLGRPISRWKWHHSLTVLQSGASSHCWSTSLMVKSSDTYGRHCCALRFISPAETGWSTVDRIDTIYLPRQVTNYNVPLRSPGNGKDDDGPHALSAPDWKRVIERSSPSIEII